MKTKITLGMLALAFAAVPASAQISTTDRVRDRVILGGDRAGKEQTRRGGTIGDVVRGRTSDAREANRVPKGHLPPRGMCRVWIDGVPPGRQPAPTTCAQAQQQRVQYGVNARVIYGDDEAFPGKGKGKGKVKDRDGSATDVLGRRGSVDRDDEDDDHDDDDRERRVDRAGDKRAKAAAKAQKGRATGKGN